jgi:hypothetical protein
VWSAAPCIADAASSLPRRVYRETGECRQQVTSRRLVDLLDYASPATTQADFVSTTMAHLLVCLGERVHRQVQGGRRHQPRSPPASSECLPKRHPSELAARRLVYDVLTEMELDPRLREIVILREPQRSDAPYAFA